MAERTSAGLRAHLRTAVALVAAAVAIFAFARALGIFTFGNGEPKDAAWQWDLGKNFPTPAVPQHTPVTAERVELGRHLFYEPRLSGNGTTSCGSCHMPSKGFTDGKAVSTGATGERTSRSALAIINIAYHRTFAWANPALATPERQMLVPLFGDNPVEMGVNDANRDQVLGRISADPRYQAMFTRAFAGADQAVTWQNVVLAISAFERTMISDSSRYDQSLDGRVTLSDAERRGRDLFFGEKAECHHCHSGINFNNQLTYVGAPQQPLKFHNTGLYNVGGTGRYPPGGTGLHEITGEPQDMGRFRAPTLRNIALTAPYMHDGSISTLEQVVAFYASGGRNVTSGPNAGDGRKNPNKDSLVARIRLTEREQADIVAFLRSLTDHQFVTDPRFSDPFGRIR